jgi:RHS repeat-associated protein
LATQGPPFKPNGATYTLLQTSDYYPFGMISNKADRDSDNKYLYNGKLERSGNPAPAGELQDELGLEWFDYGARFYDPQIGRWHAIDPVTEKAYNWTPYRYCFNNPGLISDPTGLWEEMPNDYIDINTGLPIGSDMDPYNNDVRLISLENWNNSLKENSLVPIEGSMTLDDLKSNNKYIYYNYEKLAVNLLNYYATVFKYDLNEFEGGSSIEAYHPVWAGWVLDENSNRKLELYISSKKLGYKLNNRYDFESFLKHEWGTHGARLLNGEKWLSTEAQTQIWEREAYLAQFNDVFWNKCSIG